MKTKQQLYTLLLLSMFSTMAYAEPVQQAHDKALGFHRAQMPVEHSLDAVLTQAASSQTLFCAILPKRCTPSSEDIAQMKFYSARLLSSIRKVEQNLLERECNGIYHDHELCGIDYHPILCGQDTGDDGYLYKILHEDAGAAEILSIWADTPINPSRSTRYLLIKEKGIWKLNGVDCGAGGARFNVQ